LRQLFYGYIYSIKKWIYYFMKIIFSLLVLLFFANESLFAQTKCRLPKLNDFFVKYESSERRNETNVFYVVQYKFPLPKKSEIVRRLNDSVAIIKIIDSAALEDTWNIEISPASDNWKYSPTLENEIEKDKNVEQRFIVVGEELENVFTKYKALKIIGYNKPNNAAIVKCTKNYVQNNIATLPQVTFIDNYVEPKTEVSIIGYKRSMHGINALDYNIPTANGKNIVVSVKEQNIDNTDLDVFKRVLTSPLASNTTEYHANVIATIIGGAGNSFYDGRGMANACTFFPSSFNNLFADDVTVLNAANVTVQNHSYGTIPQQFYGAESKSYDEQLWQNKNIIHVFSAGNKGTQAATGGAYLGIPGFANITGNFKMAKNIITVAAVNELAIVANESSAGPTYDGRLAPQIAALGPNGTSDAAAIVSGTMAVMQQVYKDSNSLQLPPAMLLKALLYNTATDIHNLGIDYKTGYGLINSFDAVRALQQKKYEVNTISNAAQWTKNITVPTNAANLKVTLAWTDSASTLNNNKAIINDLDVQVIENATGQIFKPWVLSSFANVDSLNKLPIRKRDSLNTSEQVSIALPSAGAYTIKVVGYNVVSAGVPFAIAYGIDTLNTFLFTSPQNTSDVDIQEAEFLNIKWKTFVADTNQVGNLSISFDAGINWQSIKQGLKIYKNEYPWKIKDTSTTAVIKMETSFGTFFSKNFIVSRVIRPQVDFLCADSFRLSWNKHAYATGYKIFTMADSAYLKPILTITDTFKVFKKANFPGNVYAVEPILGNGYNAARSVATDINAQGAFCFYKAFNYDLQPANDVKLILVLSLPEQIDSVFFEEVTAAGNLIKHVGNTKVFGNVISYRQLTTIENSGISYYRAKIKLKSGGIIYTDVLQVLSTGKKKIMFYPNPASIATGLKYVVQPGVDVNNSIQFYDATGRYIKGYKSLPNVFDVSIFPRGLILYRLLDAQNKTLEAGKILIIK
jgi:hypothetical protein